MTDLKLPELPVSPHVISGCTGPEPGDWRTWTAYTEAHMHAYATAAVLAERERVAKDAERLDYLDAFKLTSEYRIGELWGSGGSRRYVSICDHLASDDEVLGEGPTLREAIDNAMNADDAWGEHSPTGAREDD